MAYADFVHLRVHTAYSLSEGAIKIKDLAKLCQKHAMPAVAMTDTGNLFGALEFSAACCDAGIQPILGCQLAISREGGRSRSGQRPEPDQLVVLVQTPEGYANLLKLVSKAFLGTDGGETPQVTLADLQARAGGLIALTGGPAGAVGRLLGEAQAGEAEAMLKRLAEIFPNRLYVELMRHNLDLERRIEPGLLELAYRLDIPLVATNECFFADAGMYEAHDALICIAAGAYLSQGERRRLTPEHRFKTAPEMRALFADLPEAVDNTLVIAQRCAAMAEKRKPILPPYGDGHDEAQALRTQSTDGLERRLEAQVFKPEMTPKEHDHAAKPYRERLAFELDVIIQMGFPGYFLIVSDFIKWSKEEGIPVGPGRGSGAGSVVAWALTITDLDPLRWGLLFERFLNPERVSMPDFDIDFCQERREETIRYVQDKYGHDKVAQIITFGKLQARAAIRDVGRVLEMPYGQVDRISKLVPNNPANPITLKDAILQEPQLQQMRDGDETVARLLDIAQRIEGLYRHASTHAAGVVIADRPLDALVPLYRDPRSDMPVTQFNMKWVESTGLVKFDFLGLKTLTVLAKALALMEKRGIIVDLSVIPLDDRPTFEMLAKGDTTGVFQLESSGMRDVLRKLKPDCFEDIIAVVALYRPGPMDNIPKYIKVKHGDEKADYLHPTLEGILKETFGIMIYQEQVMRIAQVLSGYSLGGADLLRRAMGKKIKEEMDAQRKIFVDGARARGVDENTASHIFDQVNKFAGYGFNKSHAAAYALVAYQTAWLKANYPVEFLAASMTLDISNTDKLNTFRQELARSRIPLLAPDINSSEAAFTVEQDREGVWAIRYALAAVRNVGAHAMEALVAERAAKGRFRDLGDFVGRLDAKMVNKRQLENLVRAGAFDSLNSNRAQCFDGVETILRHANLAASERGSAQVSLFGGADGPQQEKLNLPARADWPPMERLKEEFDAIGFYLSAHPLDAYAKSLERIGAVRSVDLVARLRANSGAVKLAGTVLAKSEKISSRGNRFAFVTLSDSSGTFEVTLFSELLTQCRTLLESGVPLLITASAQVEDETVRLTAQIIQSLDEAAAGAAMGLKIVVSEPAVLAGLHAVISRQKRGKGRILLVPRLEEGREVEIALPDRYAISPTMTVELMHMPGIADVREI